VITTLPKLLPPRAEFATENRTDAHDRVQTVCAVVAFVGLAYALMHSGGRDRGAPEIALALTVPSLLVGHVWRAVPLPELLISASVVLASVMVPLMTPLGVSSVRDLNAYTYAAVLYLAVRAFAKEREHRRVVAVGLLCLGILEFLNVIRVWMGENDSSFQVVGTFYWHNQFGAFAAAIAILASAMVMRSRRPEDVIAWIIAPLFLALTWLSHSRGAAVALLVAGLSLLGMPFARRQWWVLLRAGGAIALALAVYGLLVTAVSSSGGFSPAKDSLSSTTHFRVTAAEEGLKVFDHAPLLSHGFGSLADTGWQHPAPGTTTSPYAPAAEVQALSDGGLVLGIPALLALALFAWSVIRSTLRSARGQPAPDWLRLGGSLAALALLLHASMDFDSQYPVLLGLLAVLVALVTRTQAEPVPDRMVLRRLSVAVTIGAAMLGGILVAAYWQTSLRLDTAESQLSTNPTRTAVEARLALADHHFTDPRPATFIVEADDLGVHFDSPTLQRALRESRTYARLDPRFAPVWQRVNAKASAAS